MALSTCPKAGCDSHLFEMVAAEPQHAAYKMFFIQCRKCGAVVGTEPFHNTNVMVENLQRDVKSVEEKVEWLVSTLGNMANR